MRRIINRYAYLPTQWRRYLNPLGFLFLVILMLFSLATTFKQWRTDFGAGQYRARPAVSSLTQPANIPYRPIFGQPPSTLDLLPVTAISLHLIGIIKEVGGKASPASKAIIAKDDQPGKAYKIGDAVADGRTLYSIYRNKVILDNHGQLEQLTLQRLPLLFHESASFANR